MIVIYVQASHNTNKPLLCTVEMNVAMNDAKMNVAMIVAELNVFQHRGRGYWLCLHLALEGFRG